MRKINSNVCLSLLLAVCIALLSSCASTVSSDISGNSESVTEGANEPTEGANGATGDVFIGVQSLKEGTGVYVKKPISEDCTGYNSYCYEGRYNKDLYSASASDDVVIRADSSFTLTDSRGRMLRYNKDGYQMYGDMPVVDILRCDPYYNIKVNGIYCAEPDVNLSDYGDINYKGPAYNEFVGVEVVVGYDDEYTITFDDGTDQFCYFCGDDRIAYVGYTLKQAKIDPNALVVYGDKAAHVGIKNRTVVFADA